VPTDNFLDALVFSSPDACCAQVFVAGQERVLGGPGGAPGSGVDDLRSTLAEGFVQTMRALWA
jgi:hypothetical protein